MGGKNVDDIDDEHKDDLCDTLGCVGCVVYCALLFIAIPASIIVIVVLKTPSLTDLDISSNIHSFSIAIDNNSSTALCDIALSLRKNMESCKNLNLDIVMASVYYKKDRIWTRPIPPFGLPQGEPVDLRLNLTAWLPGWAAEEFRYGRVLAFDFLLEGIGSYDEHLRGEEAGALVRVWCGGFKAEYASHSDSGAAVQLVHGPCKCDASLKA